MRALKDLFRKAPADASQDLTQETSSVQEPLLEAPSLNAPEVDVAPAVEVPGEEPPRAVAGRRFALLKGLSRGKKSDGKPRQKIEGVPIRVIIGYLPDVTERDALDYSLGVAEKYFEQLSIAFFDTVRYGKGYAYEIHEGGEGKAFLPKILEYFEAQGPFQPGEVVTAVIKTATRKVEVQRQREGLSAVILPQNSPKEPSPWLYATESMQPAMNKRTGFFVVGAAIFVTGFSAMIISSMLTRFQPRLPPEPPKLAAVNILDYPISQLAQLKSVAYPRYVKALKYAGGRWLPPELGYVGPTGSASEARPGAHTSVARAPAHASVAVGLPQKATPASPKATERRGARP